MGLYDDLVIDRRAQCPYCRSSNIDKRAYVPQPDGKTKQLTFCNDCGKSWRIVWSSDLSKVLDIDKVGEGDDSLYHIM